MTLIVARVKDGKLYMLGDTELTFHNQRQSNPFAAGCLKQYIVSDHIAIGFAGVREHFEKVLPDFLSCRTGQEIVEHALDAQSDGLDFDLLVLEVGYEKIRAVKNGVLSQSKVAFIGNHDAFNAFQRFYHEEPSTVHSEMEVGKAYFQVLRVPEPKIDEEIYSRLFFAFRRVIWDQSITGVGGVIVPLCTDKGSF